MMERVISRGDWRSVATAMAGEGADHKLQIKNYKTGLSESDGWESKRRKGVKSHTASAGWLSLLLVLVFAGTGVAQTNSWVNSNSGRWDDANSWSLGILPNSSETVEITNDNTKTVTIDAATASSYPTALRIEALTIAGSNTLVVGQLGTNALQVLSQDWGSLSVTGGGRLVNNSSGITTAGLFDIYDDGTVIQNGGYLNGVVEMFGGAQYSVTNATLTGGEWLVFNCLLNQVNCAGDLTFLEMDGGTYNLLGGSLKTASISLSAREDGVAFLQQGATNHVAGSVSLFGPADSWPYAGVQYTMEQGSLCASNMSVYSGGNSSVQAWFVQDGGLVIITNSLIVNGGDTGDHFSSFPVPGGYNVHNGTVYVGSIQIGSDDGGFGQDDGCKTVVAGDIDLIGGFGTPGALGLGGGTLNCNNVTGDGAVDISQSAGTFTVSNLFRLAGSYTTYPCYSCLVHGISKYDFSGGTLFASNIEVDAQMIIGSSTQSHRITNSGYFKLAGIIDIGDANESLGRFILASNMLTTNVLINFTGNNTVLGFAKSSQEMWSNSVTLLVSNWNGSFAGSGSEQLKFGTSASGLTSAQLNQILFVNPVRLPAGLYPARILSTGEIVPATGSINYWIKGVTGAWQETNSWSLHALPSASQSIVITGSWLNVHIDPDTKNNYPQTLTVGDVTVGGSATTFMLNYISENIPFHALNGLTVAGESPTNRNSLLCLQSGMFVDKGGLYVTNGQVGQDGGFIEVTNGDTWLNNGQYFLTNGAFDVGTLWLGSSPTNRYASGTGSFFQYGGTVTASNIQDGSVGHSNLYNIYGGDLNAGSIAIGDVNEGSFNQYGGHVTTGNLSVSSQFGVDEYSLFDGELTVAGSLNIFANYGNEAFYQGGGTNRITGLSLSSRTLGGSTSYTLAGGLLGTSNVFLGPLAEVNQTGSRHIVSGTLTVQGQGDRYGTDFAEYFLTDSYLSARDLQLQCGWLEIANSTVIVSNTLYLNLAAETLRFSEVNFSGGSLSCLNAISDGAGANIAQTGGSFTVSNLLKFGGVLDWYGYSYPVYSFSGGTLLASNIEVDAEWTIASSASSGGITNAGYFQLSGLLDVGDVNEHLGRFILGNPIVRLLNWEPVGTNAVITFAGNNTILVFADSSHESWSSSNLLMVASWNGSLAGGGSEQLKFGNNGSGLTAAQVGLIRFVNPTGFPSGTYAAKILSTGEVVPDAPMVSAMASRNGMVISWADNSYTLQAATNVLGPWTNVVATSPYTNSFSDGVQGFFRLER